MAATETNKRRTWRWVILLAVVLAGAAAVGVGLQARSSGDNPGTPEELTFTVQQGPLNIAVTESGTIEARELEILKSEVEGLTTIIYLIPEGKQVKKGELLIELDGSSMEDDKVEQQIRTQNAKAAFIQAREELAVAKSQAESDIAKAKLDYQFAQEDVKQYLDGEFPKQLKEAESNITLAKEELERASEKLKWSETLFKEKYISQTELEADRLTRNRAQLSFELSEASRDLLQDFTYHRNVAQLKSDVEQTRMALDRVLRKAQADVVQAEANLTAKELEYKQQQDKLDKIEEQLKKTKIYAPVDGMAIYATSAQGSWRGNQEPLDEGQTVRERQELIYLPTADAMMAAVKIHESNLDKVKVGLPVEVRVDALPGKIFTGKVATIAPLPDAQSIWLNPDLKIYNTQIYLDGTGEGLRTGMSCRASIIVEEYDSAIYVPVQTVLRVGQQPTTYVLEGKSVMSRPVEIGLDNNRMVRIISGLKPGEQVLLAPPLESGTAPVEGSRETKRSRGQKPKS